MSPRRWPLPLLALLALGLARATAADPDPAADDEQTLRAADLPTDGPGLLDFLRKRTLPDADRLRALGYIRQCGDADFDVRERASADLRAMGSAVRPLLRDALSDPDPEVVFRAQCCLAAVKRSDKPPAALSAAVRALGRLNPPGTVEVLLAGLPTFEDADVADDACRVLAAAAVRLGETGPGAGPGARRPLGRSAGGGRRGLAWAGADVRPVVYKLLQDSDPAVRQRVALALLEARDREAMPTLIGLLAETAARAQRGRRGSAAAGGRRTGAGAFARRRRGLAPQVPRRLGRLVEAARGAAIDLAKIDFASRRLGYTLVAEMDLRGIGGRVIEYDAAGKERWQIAGLRYVIDAQVVGPDRVLIAEYIDRRVTEHNLKGEVLWQYRANGLVLGARRLADGNVFVVARNQLVEVDKDGKEVSNLPRPNDVCAAAKFRDGSIALLTNGGQVIHLDASGKEIKTLPLNAPVLAVGTNIEALPDGHVLVPLYSTNRVMEIDADGKTVWEATTQQPTSVARLPNGHTLVGSRLAMTVVDLDRDGKEVKSIRRRAGRSAWGTQGKRTAKSQERERSISNLSCALGVLAARHSSVRFCRSPKRSVFLPTRISSPERSGVGPSMRRPLRYVPAGVSASTSK